MNPNVEYKKLKFDPFNTKNCNLINNVSDPDVNLFNESHLQNLDTPYLNIEEAKAKLFSLNDPNSFDILHLNIRSLNKNFDNFKTFLAECSHNFSIICLTETWCTDDSFKKQYKFSFT